MSIEIGTVNHFGIDSKKVQEFYRANWNRPIALADDDFYTWQFKSAPTQKNLDTCVLCYDSKNSEILGVMGVNNRTFIINGESKSGAEMTTWIISKALQGSGIGTKIISHIQSDYEVVSGFGISDVALRVYMRQNFRF
ncbi:MAG: GNAT family N-acetyltransferase, partial [Actinobacteria bacterium]|nr:GNAT family N-acetyltransferase [Actinomycetota bacterium]